MRPEETGIELYLLVEVGLTVLDAAAERHASNQQFHPSVHISTVWLLAINS